MPIRPAAHSPSCLVELTWGALVSVKAAAPGRAAWLALCTVLAVLAVLPASSARAQASNDNFASATVLTGLPTSALGSNVLATRETGEPVHAGAPIGPSVWYEWTPASSGRVIMDACDANFDTVLGVYTGTAVNALTQITARDDGCGVGALVGFEAVGGTTYKIAVAGFDNDAGSFTLNISAAADAIDDARAVDEDSGPKLFDVLTNDTDADGGLAIEITGVSDPANGSAGIVQGTPDRISYTPDVDYCNEPGVAPTDDFTYTILGGDTATVSVTVTCASDVPFANDDAVTVGEDSGARTFAVLGNDVDAEGDTIEITGLSSPAHGTVAIVQGAPDRLSYTPFADYCNDPGAAPTDNFTYTVNGGDAAIVAVTVTCVDDLPFANDDARTVSEDSGPNVIGVLSDDSDAEGDAIEIVAVSDPARGTAAVVQGAPDQLTYIPDANYCNGPTDNFSYTVNGGDTATVAMSVTCVDDPTVANDDVLTVIEDSVANVAEVLGNDVNVDGEAIEITAVSKPAHGSADVIQGAPDRLVYTPDFDYCNEPGAAPADNVVYTVAGGDTAIVAITVTCVEDPTCAGKKATIVAPPDRRVVMGTPGPDVIVGSSVSDVIDGRGGDDTICAGKGNDRVRGGAGKDNIRGGTGDDLLEGGTGNDRLDGEAGKDRLLGQAGRDVLIGGNGNDDLRGGPGNDRTGGGGAGNDRVDGGSGNDRIDEGTDGGRGRDRMFGGPGNDVVRLTGGGPDRVDCGSGRDRVSLGRRDSQRRCERVSRRR